MVKLSICIPTHNGRAWSLAPAVDGILSQIEAAGVADEVEICVSDNGSTDETAHVMAAALKRAPNNVVYHRFPLDVGPYNFLNSVCMARGEFCWFMGSDDLVEPGAVQAVLDLLARRPNCSGATMAHRFLSFDMTREEPGHPRSYYPDDYERERQFDGFREAMVALALPMTFMSVQIFRRDLWNEIVAAEPPEFTMYSRYHLHAYLLGTILQRNPHWVWSPESIVQMRGGNADVVARTGVVSYGHSLAVLRDMDAIWTRICGRERATLRALLDKGCRVTWSPSVVRHTKMLPNHRGRDDIGMLVGFARYLYPSPVFWQRTFWALLTPHWFWKGLVRTGIASRLKRAVRRTTD